MGRLVKSELDMVLISRNGPEVSGEGEAWSDFVCVTVSIGCFDFVFSQQTASGGTGFCPVCARGRAVYMDGC